MKKTTRTNQHLSVVTLVSGDGEEIDFTINSKTRVAHVEILKPSAKTLVIPRKELAAHAEAIALEHNIPLLSMVLARIAVSSPDGKGQRAEWCPGLR